MAHVTVPARPLLSVGTWSASTGEEVVTEEDLHAIVAASHSGALDAAIIKLGHTSARNDFSDGEPAYGQVTNLRVHEGTLIGDFVNVPVELAEALPSAYPHLSVELARNVKLRDVHGQVAHAFDVVLTAAALLGETPPAVKGLSQKTYAAFRETVGEEAFDYTTAIDSAAFAEAAFAAKKKTAAEQAPTPAEDTPAEDTPAEEPPAQPAPATPAHDPAEPPATLPDPAEAPAPKDAATTAGPEDSDAGQKRGDTPVLTPPQDEIAESSPEPPTPAPPTTPAEGVPPMSSIDEQAAALRKKYDLPENTSYKDLLAKVLEEKVVAGVNQDPVAVVAPGSDETPNEEVAEQIAEETARRQSHNLSEGQTEQAPVQAPVVELDNLYVSRSAFSELMSDYEATKAKLAERERAETAARRDALVSSWFRAGLIHKEERAKIREQLDVAEETVVALTAARTPIYSVAESGHALADEAHFAEATDETKAAKIAELDDAIFGA